MRIYICKDLGVSGLTPVHIREENGMFEARMGVDLLGYHMMSDEQLEAYQYNPFDKDFFDNFVTGFGNTEEEAIEEMRANMTRMSESLFE